MDRRTTGIAAIALIAGAAAGAAAGVAIADASRPRVELVQQPTPPFKIAPRGEPLPAVPAAPEQGVTLQSPSVGDATSITERYRPAFRAMGYEIGFVREGVVGTDVRYTWWAHKRFEQPVLLPRLGRAGFQTNPYGQPESEEAVSELLDRVKQAEGRR